MAQYTVTITTDEMVGTDQLRESLAARLGEVFDADGNPFAVGVVAVTVDPDLTPRIGRTFSNDEALPWTRDGERVLHRFTVHAVITDMDTVGFNYDVTAVTDETDRPPFAIDPRCGSMAHFAVPLRADKGTLRFTD